MKQPQKRSQILLAVALLLYACGYLTQFIGNYAVWQKNGSMLGGTSPPFPSLSPLACLKGVLCFPYNLYCMAGCAAAVAVIFLYRKLFSQDALTDSERNFDFSAKGTYGTSGWMQPREVPRRAGYGFRLIQAYRHCVGDARRQVSLHPGENTHER